MVKTRYVIVSKYKIPELMPFARLLLECTLDSIPALQTAHWAAVHKGSRRIQNNKNIL